MAISRKSLFGDGGGITYGTGSNSYGKYYWIKYGNGLLEQGGIITNPGGANFTYSFPLAFSTVYQILTTTYDNASNGATVRNVTSFTTTSFTTKGQWGEGGTGNWEFSWRAIGTPKN